MNRAVLLGTLLVAATSVAAQTMRPENRNQPIEINADRLEVQQEKQIAVFSGNVDATQGDFKMKADQLRVFYREQQQASPPPQRPTATRSGQAPARTQPLPPRPAQPQSESGLGGSIQRIEANGSVFLSSPSETASGDRGVYDVDKQTFRLDGQKVVLTRGKSVLNCGSVLTNMETGVSQCEGASGTATPGRVRGVFMPEPKRN
jgi:lipopolysaccharide export system protein LptA